MTPRRQLGGLAGAAALVAAVTLLSRVAGFGRTYVFSTSVGQNCLGTAYTAANTLPNVLFEVAAGGALAGVVVPLLATAFRDRDLVTAGRTASALLTWTVLVLVPLALLLALASPLLAQLLAGMDADDAAAECSGDGLSDTIGRMLLVFAPQVPLYGIAVVTAGLLQAQRRFLAAAAAPLASTIVVVGAYAWFGSRVDTRTSGLDVAARDLAVLTVGTTAGVLVLALATLLPALGTARLRPTLAFPPGVAARAKSLALAGLATVVAQQLLTLLVVVVATDRNPRGAPVVWSFAWAVYLLPYAVLVVPLATSAFPRLAATAGEPDRAAFARTCAMTTRAVVLAAGAGTALLVAAARPASQLLHDDGDPVAAVELSRALVAIAPGLLGYALLAHLGRVLYALHAGRAAATAAVAGWGTAAAVDLVLGVTLPTDWVVAGFGVGNAAGMTVTGVLLLRATRQAAGGDALAGVLPTTLLVLCAGLVAGGLGAALAQLLAPEGRFDGLVAGAVVAAAVATAYGAVAALLDRHGLRDLAGGLRSG